MRILAIGSHPDDIELGCGGLLLKARRQGHQVYMYTAARGGASGDPRQRSVELQESASFIGATKAHVGEFDDGKLSVSKELINSIESFIDEVDPNVILTHSSGDVHHDHRAVAMATLEAARFYSNILSYEIPLTKDFEPKVFFDISDVIDEKIKLIRIFWSQQGKLYLKANAIKGLAEYRALQSRLNGAVDYVEAFEVMKMCVDQDFRIVKVPHQKVVAAVAKRMHLDEVEKYA
jgi:LmbE family N-acetylglucosaminyl deacetylase